MGTDAHAPKCKILSYSDISADFRFSPLPFHFPWFSCPCATQHWPCNCLSSGTDLTSLSHCPVMANPHDYELTILTHHFVLQFNPVPTVQSLLRAMLCRLFTSLALLAVHTHFIVNNFSLWDWIRGMEFLGPQPSPLATPMLLSYSGNFVKLAQCLLYSPWLWGILFPSLYVLSLFPFLPFCPRKK